MEGQKVEESSILEMDGALDGSPMNPYGENFVRSDGSPPIASAPREAKIPEQEPWR